MRTLKINHLAVWAVAILTQAVAPLFYSEVFFGIRWAELNELTVTDFEDFNMATGLIFAFTSGLIAAYAMAWIFTRLPVESGLEGLKVALVIWLAFVFFEMATQNMFTLRPFELTLIDQSVVLVKYEIIGIILGTWRKYELQTA